MFSKKEVIDGEYKGSKIFFDRKTFTKGGGSGRLYIKLSKNKLMLSPENIRKIEILTKLKKKTFMQKILFIFLDLLFSIPMYFFLSDDRNPEYFDPIVLVKVFWQNNKISIIKLRKMDIRENSSLDGIERIGYTDIPG